MTDLNLPIEAFRLVYQIRGHRYTQQVWRSLERIGPIRTVERFVRPEMTSEEKETYKAAIDFMTLLTPPSQSNPC